MEIERFHAAPEPVIEGQRRSHERTPRAIRGQDAAGFRITEKPRHVVNVLNVRILNDRMEIVEMEFVPEVIRVDRRHQRDETNEDGEGFPAHYFLAANDRRANTKSR